MIQSFYAKKSSKSTGELEKIPKQKTLALLKGARQVGKTWLMKEFGKIFYSNIVYIDFYHNQQARVIFDGDLKPGRIIEELGFISIVTF